ncbi:MAG: hypothetical protein [Caudoviricetes sp.]|nr:MAG: hypothetical protein [Caudoviricetes sp.]
MKVIKPTNLQQLKTISDIPVGKGFMINDSLYVKLQGDLFFCTELLDVRPVKGSRADACATEVSLELKVV